MQFRQVTDQGFTLNPIGMMVPAIGSSFLVDGGNHSLGNFGPGQGEWPK
jgi:hypothetical protein